MDYLTKAVNWISKNTPPKKVSSTISSPTNNFRSLFSVMNNCDRTLIRIAGISGAIAVIMGAYGAHVFRQKQRPEEFKVAYETGNRYHLIHSAVLLAAPLTRRPQLVGGLLIGGMLLFSGGCYLSSLTDNQHIRKVTPFGGLMLIAAWVCMAL